MRVLVLSLALAAASLVAACGDKNPESGKVAAASAPAKAAPAAAAASVTVGKVFVAPVSKIASAPGIDPMKASTLPPMPMSARASGPVGVHVASLAKH